MRRQIHSGRQRTSQRVMRIRDEMGKVEEIGDGRDDDLINNSLITQFLETITLTEFPCKQLQAVVRQCCLTDQ